MPLICVCAVVLQRTLNSFCTGEYVQVIVDYGGRVEDLRLKSQSGGQLRTVLLTHNGNETAIIQNAGWMGMLLIPWANRIAYVSDHASLSFEWSLHYISQGPFWPIYPCNWQSTVSMAMWFRSWDSPNEHVPWIMSISHIESNPVQQNLFDYKVGKVGLLKWK